MRKGIIMGKRKIMLTGRKVKVRIRIRRPRICK